MRDYREQLVGGAWRPGAGGEFDSIDPYAQAAWARVSTASEADVDAAVAAASAAFDRWRRTPGHVRGAHLIAMADVLERNVDHLAEIETRDNGKIVRENRGQILFAARIHRYFAGLADKIHGETKPLDNYSTIDFTTREPVGVCALVTAWNSPLQLLANKLPPAFAAGNTVVIKPSEYTSTSTLEFARLCGEIGLPDGVLNVVTGGADTGAALTSHPGIAKISLTGGTETARAIATAAAQNIVPCTLELGGKSANIVFDDADLDRAIPGAASGIFAAAGQTCVAGSRLFVHRSVYDRVVKGVAEIASAVRLGDPMDPETQIGPMATEAQHAKILRAIEAAHEDGARLVTGGTVPGARAGSLFVLPTVFADVESDMRLATDEVFGPVLAVLPFDDDDEVVAAANDSRYGLAAGLWSQDITRAHTVAKELRAGSVWINTYRTSAAQAPFGGFRHSGYGRERGTEGLMEYTRVKNTMIDLSDQVRDPFVLGR